MAFPKTSEGFVWGPEVLEAKMETSSETLSLFLPFTLPVECWSTWEPVLDSKIRAMDLLYVDKNNNEHTVTLEDIWQDFFAGGAGVCDRVCTAETPGEAS